MSIATSTLAVQIMAPITKITEPICKSGFLSSQSIRVKAKRQPKNEPPEMEAVMPAWLLASGEPYCFLNGDVLRIAESDEMSNP